MTIQIIFLYIFMLILSGVSLNFYFELKNTKLQLIEVIGHNRILTSDNENLKREITQLISEDSLKINNKMDLIINKLDKYESGFNYLNTCSSSTLCLVFTIVVIGGLALMFSPSISGIDQLFKENLAEIGQEVFESQASLIENSAQVIREHNSANFELIRNQNFEYQNQILENFSNLRMEQEIINLMPTTEQISSIVNVAAST